MKTQTTQTTTSGTQFVVVLDAKGRPIALAPLTQLKNTTLPADRIRILQSHQELSETWK